jgi:asparagine synthetase B (glutamine-hydrolysing)
MCANQIGRIAYALDQPTVDGVNSYFVSMAARRGVTVAISGTGGDELFCRLSLVPANGTCAKVPAVYGVEVAGEVSNCVNYPYTRS